MFSVPLNPKLNQKQFEQFVNFLKLHRKYIYDVYFTCRIPPFTQDAMGEVFTSDTRDLIHNALLIKQHARIEVSATFNNINVRPDQKNLDTFIKNFKPLYDKGIRSITLPHTTWLLTGQIQKAFPDLLIKNTILRQVSTAAEVAKQAEAGFKYINIDRNLIRNRDELIKINKVRKKYNVKIALLANEGCLGNCPIMAEHFEFNMSRTNGPQYFNDPISRISCAKWNIDQPVSALKSANIAPWKEDWDELLEYVDVFKMHGRESVQQIESTMSIVRNYSEGKEILFDEFDQYINDTNLDGKPILAWRQFIKNCKFDCWDCNKCDKLYDSYNERPQPSLKKVIASAICTTYLD